MAGDWTAIEHDTIRKPEIGSLIARTGRSQHECFGLVVHFWGWAETVTIDGKIDMPISVLPSLVGGDAAFWEAVRSVGWLECLADGTLLIPRADHWLTKGAKARLKESRRKRVPPEKPRKESGKKTEENVPTEENRTEESPKGFLSDPVPAPSPDGLESHRGSRSESVFQKVTKETLQRFDQLRRWFEWQATTKKPVLDSNDSEAWQHCIAAAIQARDGDNPPAYFATLVGSRKGRQKIHDKFWNRAAEIKREKAIA